MRTKHIGRLWLSLQARTLASKTNSSFEARHQLSSGRSVPGPWVSRIGAEGELGRKTGHDAHEHAPCLTRLSRTPRNSVIGAALRVTIPQPGIAAFLAVAARNHSTSQVVWQDENEPPRLLVVQPRIHPLPVLRAKLLEALRLAMSLEDPRHKIENRNGKRLFPPYVLVQSPSDRSSKRFQAGAYFGSGTVDIVRVHIDAASLQNRLDAVFVNAQLSGIQQRNLERAWGKPVIDRVGLIIKIFGAHAQTKAAKLQVEMASLDYNRSRLVRAKGSSGGHLGFGADGGSEVVSARGRATGTIGGAGETELQLQRRRIQAKHTRLKRMLIDVDRTQSLHRSARQRQGQGSLSLPSRLPVVAVVGYTNAGKSSLLAALSKSPVYVDDRLFATLDTRSRRVVLPSGQKAILSDTVGFISDLPIQLVKAFRSTLDEVVEADFLLHVIDSSAPNANEQRDEVLRILEDVGVSSYKLQHCIIEVWNKIDVAVEESRSFGVTNVKQSIDRMALLPDGEEQMGDQETCVMDLDSDLNSGHSLQVERDTGQNPERGIELLGLRWAQDGVSCVATSAHTRMGLQELCQLLDEKLANDGGTSQDQMVLSQEYEE